MGCGQICCGAIGGGFVAGGAAPWSPKDVYSEADIVLWNRAALGYSVGTWASQIGANALAQGAGAKQPTVLTAGAPSGVDALNFDRAASQFLKGTFTWNQPATIFLACWWDRTISNQYCFDGGVATDSPSLYSASLAGNPILYGSGAGPTIAVPSATWLIICAQINGTSSKLSVNGGAWATSAANLTANPGGLTLGCPQSGSAAGAGNLRVSELIGVKVAASDSAVAATIAAMKAYTGIA